MKSCRVVPRRLGLTRSFALAAGILLPATCFASADPAVLFWIGGAAASYLAGCTILIVRIFTLRMHWIRPVILAIVSVPCWWLYLESGGAWIGTQTALLAMLPWLFVISGRPRA